MDSHPLHSHKDLDVWQKSVQLVTELYKATRGFPADERFGLTNQIRRAATSIPSNIAEGWGRGSTREYVQFLTIARGSASELDTHLVIARNLGFLEEPQSKVLQGLSVDVSKMLNQLIRSLRAKEARKAA